MVRATRLLTVLLILLVASCVEPKINPPQNGIQDIRLDIKRCPVHDEMLIESVQSVNLSRGQYLYPHHEFRAALFPCAYDDPHSLGELARVTYCPKCRFAKAKYVNDENQPSLPHELLLGEDNEEVRKWWLQAIDAFIARHRRELEQEYGKGH